MSEMVWYISFSVYSPDLGIPMAGVECLIDGVPKGTQSDGVATFEVTTETYTYELVVPIGAEYVSGYIGSGKKKVPASGTFTLPVGWPPDDPAYPFVLAFEINPV